MSKKTRSFTLDSEILDKIESNSKDVGVSTNAYLNIALRSLLGLPTKEDLVAQSFANTSVVGKTERPLVQISDTRNLNGRREIKPFTK